MKIHKLKLKEDYILPILKKDKTFELRKDDRNFEEGDVIVFTDLEGQYYRSMMIGITNSKGEYETSPRVYEITYKLKGFDGLDPDYCILAIKEIPFTLKELEHLEKIGFKKSHIKKINRFLKGEIKNDKYNK